eukprot:gene5296-5339_t
MASNSLSGTISSFISATLFELDLSGNLLTGSIPDPSTWTQLRLLRLDLNALTGTVPELGSLRLLDTLSLSHNHLDGTLPSVCGNTYKLTRLDVSHNRFEGTIPQSLLNCHYLSTVDLSHNQFQGAIDGTLTRLCYLTALELSHNRLAEITAPKIDTVWLPCPGRVEVQTSRLPDSALISLSLRNNTLSGEWTLGTVSKIIQTLDISHNSFTGRLPRLLQSGNTLRTVLLAFNSFNGSISELGNASQAPQLRSLDLRSLELSSLTSSMHTDYRQILACADPVTGVPVPGCDYTPSYPLGDDIELLLLDGNPLRGNLSQFLSSMGIKDKYPGASGTALPPAADKPRF